MSNGNSLQLNQLTKLSSAIASLSPELSRYYLLNRADCTANSLKASNHKLNYCKVCYSSLIPGKNAKVAINSNTKPNNNAVLNLQIDPPIKVDKSEKKLMQVKKKKQSNNNLQNFIEYKCEHCEQSSLLRGLSKSSKSELKSQFKKLKLAAKLEKEVKSNEKTINNQTSQLKANANTNTNIPPKSNTNNSNTSSKSKKPVKKKTTTLKSLLAKKDDDSTSNSSTNFSLDDFLSNL
ncbi:hypothetical protein CONCODRAFT_5944 [Conidiobolus coronatus NRRL 28638]|uniref:Uncharacterized protein n=1 Tax=Conidiobolus coronatus (strain ATCC 28846 / CBS 209.66 / NRRL 28638) TaxID=796925 RepID=A0A137P8S3_CONC2|nr:hypothetical protein CONCODRAFT_5944 [Conidiobolus coronatus NRRL 28638]|eukprot:KXN71406.1 hypothetical protein CONCODRAFT_5944 [Conidiobolus coronatus NRRL 28638]